MWRRTPSLVVQLHLKPLINNNREGNSSNAHYCLFANPTALRRNRTWTAGTPAMMRSMLWWATSLAISLAANKSCDGLANNHSSQNAQWVGNLKHNGIFTICSRKVSLSVVEEGTASGKEMISFRHCPNYLHLPPHSPNSANLQNLFSDVKIQDLKVSW